MIFMDIRPDFVAVKTVGELVKVDLTHPISPMSVRLSLTREQAADLRGYLDDALAKAST